MISKDVKPSLEAVGVRFSILMIQRVKKAHFGRLCPLVEGTGSLLVNGGYIYDTSILQKLPKFYKNVRIEVFDNSSYGQGNKIIKDAFFNLPLRLHQLPVPCKAFPGSRRSQMENEQIFKLFFPFLTFPTNQGILTGFQIVNASKKVPVNYCVGIDDFRRYSV